MRSGRKTAQASSKSTASTSQPASSQAWPWGVALLAHHARLTLALRFNLVKSQTDRLILG
jgi:hypothetical protein